MRPFSSHVFPGILVLLLCSGGACKRTTSPTVVPSKPIDTSSVSNALCVGQNQGCVYCVGTETNGQRRTPSELEQPHPVVCNPKDELDCVEFCTPLAPPCAFPWSEGKRCVVGSELEFHREIFNRDAQDKRGVPFVGRVVDENGRRIEGASVDLWVIRNDFPRTTIANEVTGKDGTFRLLLRAGSWTYTMRIRHTGYATELFEVANAEKLSGTNAQPRVFRLAQEATIKGKIVDETAAATAIPGVIVSAVRMPDDGLEISHSITGEDGSFTLGGLENRKYALRASKFGWKTSNPRNIQANTSKIVFKLTRSTIIQGVVHDSDGNPEPFALVAALLSDSPTLSNTPIFWSSDSKGEFAQDRFSLGTYYLWARKGDMLVYPPEKIELEDKGEASVTLELDHKGTKVRGKVVGQDGYQLPPSLRLVLSVRSSPLAFPQANVANLSLPDGKFSFQGMLPGRYELSVKDGTRSLAIIAGNRIVEIPIDAEGPIELQSPVVVRPLSGE